MAGKVAELRGILAPQNLVSQLVALYDRWHTQRTPLEAEWLELRNYIFATDTTTTSNS